MSHSYFIAQRLFGSKDTKKVSKSAVVIATAGVAVGLAVMIVSISVVLGFKGEISSKIVGFGSHLQIRNYQSFLGGAQYPIGFTSEYISDLSNIEGVDKVQRFTDKEGILKTDNGFKGVLLHGVAQDYDYTFLSQNLIEGEIPLYNDSVATQKIIISKLIADELNLRVGDRVYAYFFEESLRTRRFTVSGIYRSNLTEFDNALIYTDIYTTNKLNGWEHGQYSGVEISVDDFNQIQHLSTQIAQKVNYDHDAYGNAYCCLNIKELYPQIFSWLDLLDMNIIVILSLMIAVACFTMVSGLLIIILERTSFIGIMKALGATNLQIRNIFLHYSALILLKGLFWGNLIGLILVFVQKSTHLIHLDPTTYYVDYVPVDMNLPYIILIEVITSLLCFLAMILPCYIIANVKPVKAIKFD